jgi:uncharacterized protein (DUF924 family)
LTSVEHALQINGRNTMIHDELASEILSFWFADSLTSSAAARARSKSWFSYDPAFDSEIARRFGDLPDRIVQGEFSDWREAPQPALARIICVDQFPRNLYRDNARAFQYDSIALAAAADAVSRGFDAILHPLHAVFAYLPFEHAEDGGMQENSVELFEKLCARAPTGCETQFDSFADYARRHRDVIKRFGRFPHRNATLGRPSTVDETQYLEGGGERFGPTKR